MELSRRTILKGILVISALSLLLPFLPQASPQEQDSIAWYIVPYKNASKPGLGMYRYCAIDDYTKQIFAEGGNWTEVEVLGNRAIVKVRATNAILDALNSKYKRIPKDRLDDSLSDLPVAVKTAIKNEILDMGYTLEEIQNKFGNDVGQYTLRDVLKFMAKRRRKPRNLVVEGVTVDIVVDGYIRDCARSIESVDSEIK